MALDVKGLTKRFAVGTDSKSGMSVGEDFSAIVGEPQAFVMAKKKVVTIAGDKLNLQVGPGQIKLMGGLFKMNGFPMCILPSNMVNPQPALKLDFEIIKRAIDAGTSIASMLTIF